MVPSFHPDLLRGVATYWWEFLRAVPQLDVVYVPIGQGSGACSAIAAKRAGPRRAHRGRGQPPRHHLRRLDRRRPGDRSTGDHATGRRHGLPRGRPEALAMLAPHIDHVVQVSDAEVAAAMRA
jgi:threonine dehydratase